MNQQEIESAKKKYAELYQKATNKKIYCYLETDIEKLRDSLHALTISELEAKRGEYWEAWLKTTYQADALPFKNVADVIDAIISEKQSETLPN